MNVNIVIDKLSNINWEKKKDKNDKFSLMIHMDDGPIPNDVYTVKQWYSDNKPKI